MNENRSLTDLIFFKMYMVIFSFSLFREKQFSHVISHVLRKHLSNCHNFTLLMTFRKGRLLLYYGSVNLIVKTDSKITLTIPNAD